MTQESDFYSELLGVCDDLANGVAEFMEMAHGFDCIENINPWSTDDGSIARVYFSIKSQNRFPAIKLMHKSYYCAEDREVYIQMMWLARRDTIPLIEASRLQKPEYSGAKTRKSIERFAEQFYG